MFSVHVHTLFPEYFTSPLSSSIVGRAIGNGALSVILHDIREHCTDRHRTADDEPFGGGGGMVMKVEPVVRSLDGEREHHGRRPTYLLSPAGVPLGQSLVQTIAEGQGISLICGHYEGIDERIESFVDGLLSIGDYVLTGGEPAALVIIDALSRLLPGVLGNAASALTESHTQEPILEYPHFTRPRSFRGLDVPAVLLGGHHAEISRWRRVEALRRTRERRPDLWNKLHPTLRPEELRWLDAADSQAEPSIGENTGGNT